MKQVLAIAALIVSVSACGVSTEPLQSSNKGKTTITTRVTQQTEARDLHGLQLSAHQGRIDGDIGFFTGVHEAAPATEYYNDGFNTSLKLTSLRSDGSWGFANLYLAEDVADLPQGESQISNFEYGDSDMVVGCASSETGDQYYDQPANEVSVTVDVPDENAEVPEGQEAVAELTFLAHWDDMGATMPEQTVKGRVVLTAPIQQ